MKVKDVMGQWIKVRPETSIAELAKILDKNLTGSALVVDESKPLGVVTERDILKKIVAVGKDPKKVPVKSIMSSPVITIDISENLANASELMDKKRIRRLAVVESGKVVGKVTANTISRNFRYLLGKDMAYCRPEY